MSDRLLPERFPQPWASAWGEDRFGLWMALQINDVSHVFRWIAPGRFMMGSPNDEAGRFDREDYHEVTISRGFWLGETTVTQALWEALGLDNPSHFKNPQRPTESVSWEQIQQEFLPAFNQQHPDLNARLPWEAEWEYACRAGTQTAFHFGEQIYLQHANYRGTWEYKSDQWGEGALKQTTDVKRYPCNDWGLYDMHGNVWEWCADSWQQHLGTDMVSDPWNAQSDDNESGHDRVIRGGSWIDDGRSARSAYRRRYEPAFRFNTLGFRLALAPGQ